MDRAPWFRRYQATFFVALLATTLVRVYFALGFPPELADRGSDRLLGGFDVNLWTARLGSVAWIVALAAGAAIVVSLATRTYQRLDQGHDRTPIDG